MARRDAEAFSGLNPVRIKTDRVRFGRSVSASVHVMLLVVLGLCVVAGVVATGLLKVGAGSPTTTSDQGLSFTTPAGWSVNRVDLILHYETILAYVGTGTATVTCASDYIAGLGGTCTEAAQLADNTFVLRVSSISEPATADGPVADVLALDSRATATTVGGARAALEKLPATSFGSIPVDTVLRWTIARGDPGSSYRITAYLRGADATGMEAAINSWLSGISIGVGQ